VERRALTFPCPETDLSRDEPGAEPLGQLGPELLLQALANSQPPLVHVRGQTGHDLAVIGEAIQCALEARRIRLRRDVHDFDIVLRASDDIPRTTGFRSRRRPPIEQEMLPAQKADWLPLGALLVREGLITSEQLETALLDQQGTGLRLGELLVHWGWVDSTAISRALAEQYELDFVDLDGAKIDPIALELLDARDARRYDAIPIRFLDDESDHVVVGVADPTDVGSCDELREKLGGPVRIVVVDQTELHRTLAREYA
jgi:Type II secretion system (T2SS), protein E, N-terminal domain